MGEIGFLRGFWLDGSRRLAWLEDYAASLAENTDMPAPDRIHQGIRLENVSFAYPGTTRRVLEDLNLEFKPGSAVAIVGENGAGKSTLVKLLCRMYSPDEGRILIIARGRLAFGRTLKNFHSGRARSGLIMLPASVVVF